MLQQDVKKYNFVQLFSAVAICYMYIATIGTNFGISTDPLSLGERRVYLLIAILAIGLFYIISSGRLLVNKTIGCGLILTLYMLLLGFGASTNKFSWFSCVGMWIFIILIQYNLDYSSQEEKLLPNILCISSILISLTYIYGIITEGTILSVASTNSIYYVLCTIPLIFMCSSTPLVMIALLTSSAAILISAKSTCLIALVFIWIAFMFRNGWKLKRIIQTVLISLILLLVLWQIIRNYVDASSFGGILLSVIEEANTGGNGRFEIYTETVSAYRQLGVFKQLFGCGYNAINEVINIGTHNDFLMVLYNYGLVGFAIYIIFFVRLTRDFFRLYSEKSKYTFAFAVSLIVFFCVSMASNVLNTQIQFLLLCLFWGMSMPGRIEFDGECKVDEFSNNYGK